MSAADPPPSSDPRAPASAKKRSGWLMPVLRWSIAIVGIAWVVSGLTIRDRVYVLTEDDVGEPIVLDAALAEPFDPETDDAAVYTDPTTGESVTAPTAALLHGPDQDTVTLTLEDEPIKAKLAGMRLVEPLGSRGEMPQVTDLWVYTPVLLDGNRVHHVNLAQSPIAYDLQVPQPLVRTGLASMVREARPILLILALLVFPITLVCTGLRWWRLMAPLGIEMQLRRAYALNMVGLFYNTFMLGSTGGDFVKAFYAGRHARPGRKAAAWMSVFVDRIVGLLVLVVMGGTAAGIQYALSEDRNSQVAQACLHVIWASVALLGAAMLTVFIALHRPTRRLIRTRTGLDHLIERAAPESDGFRSKLRGKVRESLNTTYDVVNAYRLQPGRIVEACLLTVPVHGAVIISALLAGTALGLPIAWPYYFVAVPVIVLSASLPISPQGAGVMEFFAVLLTRPQGATVAQAFALALCIRVVHIVWNLTGGIFVFRGGYSQPTANLTEETDDAEEVDRANTATLPVTA